jgi:hypothetical protein
MFSAMIVNACAERVPAGSLSTADFIAARTSGGRFVDVWTMSWRTLSKKDVSMATSIIQRLGSGSAASEAPGDVDVVNGETRIERDPLGEVRVPDAAYYGAQTARAVENFPISGLRAHPDLVTATILVKKAAAAANKELNRLDADVADAVVRAADEILGGALRDQFVEMCIRRAPAPRTT